MPSWRNGWACFDEKHRGGTERGTLSSLSALRNPSGSTWCVRPYGQSIRASVIAPTTLSGPVVSGAGAGEARRSHSCALLLVLLLLCCAVGAAYTSTARRHPHCCTYAPTVQLVMTAGALDRRVCAINPQAPGTSLNDRLGT